MNILNKKAQIVVIGGKDEEHNFLNDIWVFDLLSMNWMMARTSPNDALHEGICNHATVVKECRIYVYGGSRKQCERVDFWTIEL